jgi:hypothetical protein
MSKTTITGIKANNRLSPEPLIDRLTKLSITYDPLSSRVNLDGFKQDLSKEEFKRQLTKVTDDDDDDDHNNNDDDDDNNDDDVNDDDDDDSDGDVVRYDDDAHSDDNDSDMMLIMILVISMMIFNDGDDIM